MGGEKILLIEDEAPLAAALQDFLEDHDYNCHHVSRGDEGLRAAREESYQIIVLDRMLPGLDGLAVCQQLRQSGVETPIIFLTAKGSESDRIDGLNAGADDYLPKPFSSPELLARISAVLRRSSPTGSFYSFGPNTLDCNTHQLNHSGEDRPLTAKEYELLIYFIEHKKRVISRGELLEKIWGYSSSQVTRTVDTHIAALRQKIEVDPTTPQLLITLHGQGYRFTP